MHRRLREPSLIWCRSPSSRYNERELRWAALDTWTFALQFEAPRSLLQHTAVLLRCDGLDTVASVELNGSPIGTAVNAHRPHSWDVTQLLAEGPNRLSIRLDSAAAYAAAQRDAYPYPVPHTQQVGAVPGYNFIRKAARQAVCLYSRHGCLAAVPAGGVCLHLRLTGMCLFIPRALCPCCLKQHSSGLCPPAATSAGTGAPHFPLLASLEAWSWWGTAPLC